MADVEAPVSGVQAIFTSPPLAAGTSFDGASAAFSSDALTSFILDPNAAVAGVSATFAAASITGIVSVEAPISGAHATFDSGYLEIAGSAVASVSGASAVFDLAPSLTPDLTAHVYGLIAMFGIVQLAPFGQDCQDITANRVYEIVGAGDDEVSVASSANTSSTIVTASDHYHDDEVYPPWQ